MKRSLGISNFLEEISSLSHVLFSSISLHWSLRKSFFSLLAVLWHPALKWVYLSFSPLPICKASSDNHFTFLNFFFLGMALITASCTMSWASVHSSSGTLLDLIPWIYLSLPQYKCKAFDLGHTWMVLFSPTFFNLSLNEAERRE